MRAEQFLYMKHALQYVNEHADMYVSIKKFVLST